MVGGGGAREERWDGETPDHLTYGLDVRKMTIHPVVVKIRKCRHVLGLAPDTLGCPVPCVVRKGRLEIEVEPRHSPLIYW